jgi:co-chaperonin GroES (HSP10)
MKPVNGWILVKRLEVDEKTPSGIYIPKAATSEQKIQRNEVLQISQDVYNACEKEGTTLPYKVGDIVLTHVQVGIQYVPYDKENNILFLKFDTIMGVE